MGKKYGLIIKTTIISMMLLAAAAAGLSGCGDAAPDPLWGGAGGLPRDMELHWLDGLPTPPDPPGDGGELRQAWQLRENLILLHQVREAAHSFHLFHADTGKQVPIVPAAEHAVLEKVAGDQLFFAVKRVGANGNQEFPQRLVFDLAAYKVTREKEAFFRRDTVFGGVGSPLLTLDGIYPRGDDVVLDFAYAGGQAPTGIHPLTVADYSGRRVVLRIYNAGGRGAASAAVGEESLVGRISYTELPPFYPPELVPLLRGRYPYGAGFARDVEFERPSVKIEINLREKAAYHVRMVPRATGLVYVVQFRPDGAGAVHGLTPAALADLAPEEVAALYWQARQERSLGALRTLLTDDAEVGSLAEALLQTEREWQRGRMMVVSFATGEAAVHGDRATVPVSYRQTGWDGQLVVREGVPFGLSKVDGIWKVDLSDHILALAR